MSCLLRGLDERKRYGLWLPGCGKGSEHNLLQKQRGQHRVGCRGSGAGEGLTLSCGSTRTRESHFQQGLG